MQRRLPYAPIIPACSRIIFPDPIELSWETILKRRVALLAVCAGGLRLVRAGPLSAAAQKARHSDNSSPIPQNRAIPDTGKTSPSRRSISDQVAAGTLSTFCRTNSGSKAKDQ